MVSWNNILQEIQNSKLPNGRPDIDGVRRSKIRDLAEYTGRALVTYSADFLNQQKAAASGNEVNIDFRDKEGFLEVTKDLPSGSIDILLHSAGGSAEAAESIVKLLRARFEPNFLTHARHVGIEEMKRLEANVFDMQEDPALQEKVRALYYAISITYDSTPAFKMFENSTGGAYIRLVQVQQVRVAPVAKRQPQQTPRAPSSGEQPS